jgi:predicted dehydrogenase
MHLARAAGPGGRGSAAAVILSYPHAIARCTSSSLMPAPYGMRGGWHATFTSGVLEYAMRAGFTGRGPASLTEHTADGEKPIDLAAASPYEAVIDHVLACLAGRADNRIEPASALPALELTLHVYRHLTQPAG